MRHKFMKLAGIIVLGVFLITSCNNVKDKQSQEEEPSLQTEEASKLFSSFIKEDSLPFLFTPEYLSYNYWRGIDYNSIYRFIDTDLRKYNKKMQRIIDSLNKINEGREIYEPLETQYDKKFWDDEDLDYIYNGLDYRGIRSFHIALDFTILLYMKVDTDFYSDTPESIAGPLVIATHNKDTGERIDSINIDYHKLVESLANNTGELVIKEDGVMLKLDENKKEYTISSTGEFNIE